MTLEKKETFFADQASFTRWLAENHAKAAELLVGFYKVGSGRPSMTWPQSVDAAVWQHLECDQHPKGGAANSRRHHAGAWPGRIRGAKG
jgi:hypothetical protein